MKPAVSWLVAGIVFWGCIIGLMFHRFGTYAFTSLWANIGVSVIASVFFTLTFVATCKMHPPISQEYRAFFYPIPAFAVVSAGISALHFLGAE